MRCMKKPSRGRRGAGTRACRDGTFAVARGRSCRAGPSVVCRTRYESGSHGVVLYVSHDFFELTRVSHPVIVGFGLPKGLPCATQHLVSFTRGGTFEPAEQTLWRDLGQQKHVDVVGHNHPSPQVVVAKLDATSQGVYDNAGDVLPAQVHRADSGCIQVTIHPDKRFAGPESGRRIPTARQAAVQMPGYEEPLAFQIDVWEAATVFGHTGKWISATEVLLGKFATARVPGPGRAPRQARVPAPQGRHE